MLDLFGLPQNPKADVQLFIPNSVATGTASYVVWNKPRGKSMCHILLQGPGGNGGLGAIGAVSTAAGGGGGGSGATTNVWIPTALLPDRLFIYTPAGGSAAAATVSIYPDTTAINRIAIANGGAVGGTASGATAGAGGTAGAAGTAATMPLGWSFAKVVAGIAGAPGATTGSPGNGILPNNGCLAGGGQGGAGLNASGVAGSQGGSASIIYAYFTPINGGIGGPDTVTPPGNGSNGQQTAPGFLLFYGGGGGGSTHGSAIGTGLVQSFGGDGAYGAGGGGGGGALTGSTAAPASKGGDSFCIITSW